MKKRIIKGLCLLLILFNLTGCVKFNVNMGINKDKSMDFLIIYALDKDYNNDDNIFTDEETNNIIQKGFKIEPYAESMGFGRKITKKIENIDLVSTVNNYIEFDILDITKNNQDSYIFKIDKGFLKNKYTARIKFDYPNSRFFIGENTESNENVDNDNTYNDEIASDENINEEQVSDNSNYENVNLLKNDIMIEDNYHNIIMLADDLTGVLDENIHFSETNNMNLKFYLSLPYPVLTNNATVTSTDNKKLMWQLSHDKEQYVEFQFELYNMNNIYILCGVAGLGIILIVLFIVFVIKKKKKNNIDVVNNINQSNEQNNNLNNGNLINNTNDLMNQQVISNNNFRITNMNENVGSVNSSVDMTVGSNNTLTNNVTTSNEVFNSNQGIQNNNNYQTIENNSIINNIMENSAVDNILSNDAPESNAINQPVMNSNEINTKQNNLNELANNTNNIEQNNNLLSGSQNVEQIPTPVNYENIVVKNNFNNQVMDNNYNMINNYKPTTLHENVVDTKNGNPNNNESLINVVKPEVNNKPSMNNSMPGGSYIHIPGQDENNQMGNNSQVFTTTNNNVGTQTNMQTNIPAPTPVKIDTNFSNIVNGQNQNNENN